MNYVNYTVNLNSKYGEINHLKLQLRDLLFQELSVNEMIIEILKDLDDTPTLLTLSNFQEELKRVCYDNEVYTKVIENIERAKDEMN